MEEVPILIQEEAKILPKERQKWMIKSYLNIGFAWVSLIFIHEGIFDLKVCWMNFPSIIIVMSTDGEIIFYHNKNTEDYIQIAPGEASSTRMHYRLHLCPTASRD